MSNHTVPCNQLEQDAESYLAHPVPSGAVDGTEHLAHGARAAEAAAQDISNEIGRFLDTNTVLAAQVVTQAGQRAARQQAAGDEADKG